MQTIILESDKAVVIRNSVYNHNTTPAVSWLVKSKGSGLIVRETKTKKEALEWFNICNQPRKETP
jgi:hypothetical protein